MPDFDCRTFLNVAEYMLEDLQSDQPSETDQARLRTIVGRAYYAPYGLLRSRIITACNGNCFGTSGLHDTLINAAISAEGDPHLINIGTKMNRLLQMRSRADYLYFGSDAFLTDEVAELVHASRKTCEKIDVLQVPQLRKLFEECDKERESRRSRRRHASTIQPPASPA